MIAPGVRILHLIAPNNQKLVQIQEMYSYQVEDW